MAYTKETYTFDGEDYDFYNVDGVGHIPAESLLTIDILNLKRAVAAENFNEYIMPNKMTAIEFFSIFIKTPAQFFADMSTDEDELILKEPSPDVSSPITVELETVASKCWASVEFYDINGDIVTPTAGTVAVTGKTVNGYDVPFTNSPLNATSPATMGVCDVPITAVTFTPTGVTGAVSCSGVVVEVRP